MEAPPPDKAPVLTAQQAADELGVSLRTFKRWYYDKKKLVGYKLPGPTGARVFSREDVERLKKSRDEAA